jgi:hypothetical protein
MRIIVGLASEAEPSAVATALREQGARDVKPAPPSLPDVVIADFPEDVTVQDVAALPGVRYAEPDSLQSAF